MLYADLLAAIASYTKRSDTAALAPIWITLAETRLSRELRHFRGLVRVAVAINAEFTSPPADFVALRSARLVDSPFWPLNCLNAEQMAERRAERRSGNIDSIGQLGGQLCVNPIPSASCNVELFYYAAIPALTATNTSNWVLANFPDLYLWGALAESANFYEDDESLNKYGALFRDALTGTNLASVKAESSFNLTPMPSARAI